MRWRLSRRPRVVHEFRAAPSDRTGQATAKAEARISARVWRSATGKWEDLGVVSRPSRES